MKSAIVPKAQTHILVVSVYRIILLCEIFVSRVKTYQYHEVVVGNCGEPPHLVGKHCHKSVIHIVHKTQL